MKKEARILIAGGDKRQKYLSELLAEDALNTVYLNAGTEEETLFEIGKSKVVVFPVPFTKDKNHIYSDNDKYLVKTEKALQCLSKNTVVFGAGFSKEEREYFEEEGIEYHDFLINESFLLENAYLTAEGALRLLFENTEETLFGKNVLVTGYGRISEFLCALLNELHMKVYTAARNEIQLKHAEKNGYVPVNLNDIKSLAAYDFIFNTVPVKLFDETLISTIKNGVYFELASSPFGADKNLILSKGIEYVSGASLPGKLFPFSSAVLIKDYIMKYI